MATGQAAGVCAALGVRAGVPPKRVDVEAVQHELVRQGANLRDVARIERGASGQ